MYICILVIRVGVSGLWMHAPNKTSLLLLLLLLLYTERYTKHTIDHCKNTHHTVLSFRIKHLMLTYFFLILSYWKHASSFVVNFKNKWFEHEMGREESGREEGWRSRQGEWEEGWIDRERETGRMIFRISKINVHMYCKLEQFYFAQLTLQKTTV